MHPALINEIARYHQADLLREAARGLGPRGNQNP